MKDHRDRVGTQIRQRKKSLNIQVLQIIFVYYGCCDNEPCHKQRRLRFDDKKRPISRHLVTYTQFVRFQTTICFVLKAQFFVV
jgi:hypothetical protein